MLLTSQMVFIANAVTGRHGQGAAAAFLGDQVEFCEKLFTLTAFKDCLVSHYGSARK